MDFLKHAKRLPVIDWNLTFFGAHEQTVSHEWSVPPEKHSAFECIYCLAGNECANIQGNQFELEQGDFLLIPPEFKHQVWAEHSLRYFCFHFDLDDPNLKVQLLRGLSYYYPAKSTLCKDLAPHLNQLAEMTVNQSFDFNTKMIIQIELSQILQIFYLLSDRNTSESTSTQAKYSRVIAEFLKSSLTDKIISYTKNGMMQMPAKRNLVTDAISHAGLSNGYGFRIFKETYGVSPREYLTKLKINEAKKLLMKPKQSIQEIGEALGYTSISNFSRQFKRWTGNSPSEFRERARGPVRTK